VPALRDDPGAPRHAEGLERLAGARHWRAGDPRHVPGALGDPAVDPRLRRVDTWDPVPGADRHDDRRVGLARRLPRAGAAQRAPAGLAVLTRGGVPAQRPRAVRAGVRARLGPL